MEQIYMIEIFIDTVSLLTKDEGTAKKKLIVTVKFGPKTEFVIKEGAFFKDQTDETGSTETVGTDDTGRQIVNKTIKVGKALFFPSFPDTVLQCLENFPFEISVWNNDENEVREFIGKGFMKWDKRFYEMLREAVDPSKETKPLSIKQVTDLLDECCCGLVGTISFILRLSALGSSIITTFQERPRNSHSFLFTTDGDSLFEGKRIEGDDLNFVAVGNLYHSISIEDTETYKPPEKTITICTALDSCGTDAGEIQVCGNSKPRLLKPVISKIRMGDIKGPCGNVNCTLAQKVKRFLRNTEEYRNKAAQQNIDKKRKHKKVVCGECGCGKDKWHRQGCPDKAGGSSNVVLCKGCGSIAKDGITCETFKNSPGDAKETSGDEETPYTGPRELAKNTDCSCVNEKTKDTNLCGTFDCICKDEVVNRVTRLEHKAFCPSYKHKARCPVMTMKQETEQVVEEKDSEEKEDESPTGTLPIKLSPCLVPGRPCMTQTFTNMSNMQNKVQTANVEKLPSSYSEAGKICCSKEFDRIKKFLKDYMKEDIREDYCCFNQIDKKEDKCCDKEEISGKILGTDCCGGHQKN